MERYEYPADQRLLLESMKIPFAIYQLVDKRVVTLVMSEGLRTLFGYQDKDQAYVDMAQNTFQYEHPDDAARVADEALHFATEGGTYDIVYRAHPIGSTEYHIIHAIGHHVHPQPGVTLAQIWYTDEGLYSEDLDGKGSSLFCSLKNTLHEESILRSNFYDQLTGLPSMTYFLDLAEAGRYTIERSGGEAVMLFMDLFGMKYYNTKYGFLEGDNLLRAFGDLLAESFTNDNCCRIGADHFAAYTQKEGLEDVLAKLFEKVRGLNGGKTIPLHVGIYEAGIENIPATGAFDRAKLACDSLKNRYGCCYAYYRTQLRNDIENRQYILSNLDRAIDEGWIQVYYQCIVRAVSGKISDVEALARWIDPVRGMLSPAEFIPYLEDADLIYKLDLYVLEQVLEKFRFIQSKHGYILPHSINLSRSDFESCDIVEEIRKRVDAAGVGHDKISIEITESIIGSDPGFISKQVERFRKLGFPVWMDDFGSGYSSFDVLKSIRFDLLKFDMSFMRNLEENENAKIILTELMRMATKLGVDTICEGVETENQVRFLQEIGCSKLQGYYFSRPIPFEKIEESIDTVVEGGLENPDEAEYYSKMGSVNLYDFSMSENEQKSDVVLKRHYSTIPMGIVEVQKDGVCFIRTNHSYREFLRHYVGIDLSDGQHVFMKEKYGFTTNFRNKLRQSLETGTNMVLDEQMPDGSTVHSFARSIGVNPVTGATATAVAVLSVSNVEEKDTYAGIARALAADYYNIYYVDLETDQYIEYSPPADEAELAVEKHGDDFFRTIRLYAMERIYSEDRAEFLSHCTKEYIMREVQEKGTYIKTYRLIEKGGPRFANIKVTSLHHSGRYLIIGISVVDS